MWRVVGRRRSGAWLPIFARFFRRGLLSLHELVELDGGILVFKLVEFLQRHGERGIFGFFGGFFFGRATDLLLFGWIGGRWGRGRLFVQRGKIYLQEILGLR